MGMWFLLVNICAKQFQDAELMFAGCQGSGGGEERVGDWEALLHRDRLHRQPHPARRHPRPPHIRSVESGGAVPGYPATT